MTDSVRYPIGYALQNRCEKCGNWGSRYAGAGKYRDSIALYFDNLHSANMAKQLMTDTPSCG